MSEIALLCTGGYYSDRRAAQIHMFEILDQGSVDADALSWAEDVIKICDRVGQFLSVPCFFYELRVCGFGRRVWGRLARAAAVRGLE